MNNPNRLPSRAVLDADVIFSRVLHELLGRIATELRLITLIWSDELLDEAAHSLLERKPKLSREAARRWVSYVRDAFPEEGSDISDLPDGVDLTHFTHDPDDEHVCALAVVGNADLLLTFDHGYQKGPLREHGIQVLDPDEYLCQVFDREPQAIRQVIQSQARVWGGGRPVTDLLDALGRAGAERFAEETRRILTE